MDDNPRTRPPLSGSPRTADIVGYGLLATAVAAGVLYLDGQPPRDIAVVAGAIVALLATLVLIAPRLRVQERDDLTSQPAERRRTAPAGGTDISPPARPGVESYVAPGDVPPDYGARAQAAPTGADGPPHETGKAHHIADPGPPMPGRRAKRGRRRR